jgi:hypothetical protein
VVISQRKNHSAQTQNEILSLSVFVISMTQNKIRREAVIIQKIREELKNNIDKEYTVYARNYLNLE